MRTKLAFSATIAAALLATPVLAQSVTTSTSTTTVRTTTSNSSVELEKAPPSPQPLPFGPASTPFPGDTGTAQSAQTQTYTPSSTMPPKEQSDPRANMRESRAYEQMLSSNPAYRDKRIQQECGDIQSIDVKQQCIDSFGPAKMPATKKQM